MGNVTNQKFDKSIIDIIKGRYSVRTYKQEKLSSEVKNKLTSYTEQINGPFEASVRIELVDDVDISEKADGKIGTYGVIKGATSYAAAITEKDSKNSLEQLGYVLENFILYATSLNLGTCWLGGTFNKSQFSKMLPLKDNEIMPIVTPIGYIAGTKSILETVMRFAAGSNSRKQWSELFFNESFEKPLEEKDAGQYAKALEMVRLAPSASNKQPWRIVKQGNTWHVYLSHTKGYGSALGFSIQKIDIGIGMCHFEATLREFGIKGAWKVDQELLRKTEGKDIEYIVSWIGK